MTPDVFANWGALLGFVAALGAAFCFGYAAGHHIGGRSAHKEAPPQTGPVQKVHGWSVGRTLRMRTRRS